MVNPSEAGNGGKPPTHTTLPTADMQHESQRLAIEQTAKLESREISLRDTICVDPRAQNAEGVHPTLHKPEFERAHIYNPDGVARPGADEGYVTALLAAFPELSGERATALVYDWTVARGRDFTLHVDDQGHGLGCKHVGNTLVGGDFARATKTSPSSVKDSIDSLHDHAKRHGVIPNVPVLTDSHVERWVAVSDMTNRQIPATINGTQGFRYNRAVDYDRLRDLAQYVTSAETQASEFAGRNSTEVFNALQSASDRQTLTTLLSIDPNLPMFLIDATGDTRYIGTVREFVAESADRDLLNLDILPKAHK